MHPMATSGLFDLVDAWAAALVLAVLMFGAWVIGWSIGRRQPRREGEPPGEKFSDASFALLGLLLAFTFGMSIQKHGERRAMVLAESNAIGDFYTCVTLLNEPLRARLQSVVRDYTDLHVTAARDKPRGPALQKVLEQFDEQVSVMIDLTREAVNGGTP